MDITPAIRLIAAKKGAWGKVISNQTPASKDKEPNIAPKSLSPIKLKKSDKAAVDQIEIITIAAAMANDSILYIWQFINNPVKDFL